MAGDDCAALTPAPALYERVCSSLLHGWRFWALADAATAPTPATEPSVGASRKAVRQLMKLPNQKGVPEGEVRWFCSACQRSFSIEGKQTPASCPEGHLLESGDEFLTA
jgi:hypothetical protein